MGAIKEWCHGWIEKHTEENENGTATVSFGDQKSKMHFTSIEAAEKYLWENAMDEIYADAQAYQRDVVKNIKKYGSLE